MKKLFRICHLGKLSCSMTSTNFPSGFKVSISIRNDKNEANTIFKASGFFKAIVQIWLRSLFMARAKSTLFLENDHYFCKTFTFWNETTSNANVQVLIIPTLYESWKSSKNPWIFCSVTDWYLQSRFSSHKSPFFLSFG